MPFVIRASSPGLNPDELAFSFLTSSPFSSTFVLPMNCPCPSCLVTFLAHPARCPSLLSCPLSCLAHSALVLIVLARNLMVGHPGLLTQTSFGGVDLPAKFGLRLFLPANLPSPCPHSHRWRWRPRPAQSRSSPGPVPHTSCCVCTVWKGGPVQTAGA